MHLADPTLLAPEVRRGRHLAGRHAGRDRDPRTFEVFDGVDLAVLSGMERKGVGRLPELVGAAHREGLSGRASW